MLLLLACSEPDEPKGTSPEETPEVLAQFPLPDAEGVSPVHPLWIEVNGATDELLDALFIDDADAELAREGDRLELRASLAPATSYTWGFGDDSWQFTTFDTDAVWQGSVADVVERVRVGLAPRDSGGYGVPDSAALDDHAADLAALEAGQWGSIAQLQTTSEGDRLYALLDRGSEGALLVDYAAERSLLIGAPHTGFETHTSAQSAEMLVELGARALVVNGAHRCANAAASACDGTTSVCGSSAPFRESDMAHVTDSFYQLVHVALDADVAISVHGFSWSSGPVAYVSDGTDVGRGDSLANHVRDALDAAFPASFTAASCNDPDDPHQLCGTTNTQGRARNGSDEPCGTAAGGATDTFIHLEQALDLRDDEGPLHRGLVIEALDAALP